ncbi:MAG: class I SAM-dependent methyltransferase [Desulfobacterales bacterium]|nr:class I SAM-dependent methyltransferase [Desulfobacterales bacterium]
MIRFLKAMYVRFLGNTRISFKIVFTDGTCYAHGSGPPAFVIRYNTKTAQLNTMLFFGWGLIESYINGGVDIEGDLKALIRATADNEPPLAQTARQTRIFHPLVRMRNLWHELLFGNRKSSRGVKNALAHYNRGSDIFWQYLDPTMTYTCAYWKEGTQSLEAAQENKLDHVCGKLRLKPGEHLIDVGGGWGSLLFHAVKKYGVIGTNLSPTTDQNQWLLEKARQEGMADQIRVQEKDFRQVSGTYDKYASLGVYEHAGKGQLKDWIKSMAQCLKPGGIGVLHFIAHDRPMDTDFFIRKHIFPGGYLPGLTETIDLMAVHGLEILDIENLRRHYALTLDQWAARFDENWAMIHSYNPQLFNERFRRTWRAYLHFCAEFFRTPNSVLRLYQITFCKGNTTDYPMDRGFLYRAI